MLQGKAEQLGGSASAPEGASAGSDCQGSQTRCLKELLCLLKKTLSSCSPFYIFPISIPLREDFFNVSLPFPQKRDDRLFQGAAEGGEEAMRT